MDWISYLKSITVEPVMFLYMFTVFLQFVTTQSLIYDKVCMETYNTSVCDQLDDDMYKAEADVVQKTTSSWFLYANIAMVIPSLCSMILFLGPLGDRVGRKLPVIFPLIGSLLQNVVCLVNSVYMEAGLGYLLIGSVLNGMFGGFIAALMALYSYIAHVSSVKRKTVRMGVLEAMVFLSGTLGTAISGVILDRTSYIFVYILLSSVMTLAILYTVIRVENVRSEADDIGEGPLGGLCGICDLGLKDIRSVFLCVYNKRHDGKKFLYLFLLILIIFCLMLVTVGESDILLIYTRYHPFYWSQTTLGLCKGLESFLRGVAVLTLLPVLKMKYNVPDTCILISGLCSKILSLTLFAIGNRTEVLFFGSVVGVLQGFGSASIRSMTSNMIPTNEQARLFSVIGVFEAIATLAATSIFNPLYSATLDIYPGFCFVVGTGIILLCMIAAIYLHVIMSSNQRQLYTTLHNDAAVNDATVNTDYSMTDDTS